MCHATCLQYYALFDVAAAAAILMCLRRWLEYEEAHGSAADVEGVKQRAMEYMQSLE